MKKTSTILITIVLGYFSVSAQDSKVVDDIRIGADLGFSIPTMRYSGSAYDIFDKSALFSGMGGLFVDWKFYDNLSLRPHLNFVGRGVSMKYDLQRIDYKLKPTYFDIRVPVVYTFDLKGKIKPFVAAGPSLNFASGGKITYTEGSAHDYLVRIANSNIRPFDFGLYLGAGAEYPVDLAGFPMMVGAEIGYTFGTADTFAKAEIREESNALNTPLYHIDGKRKNSNLIVALNVSIPLKNLFGKKGGPSASRKGGSSASRNSKSAEKKMTAQNKKCCSLEEMYEMILAGEDITKMKVCAFSDIRFDFDKATITPDSEQYLDMFVTLLHKFPKMRISIIGHTDNVGSAEYNLKLSKARAESVAAYFKKNGIDASRLHCEGYGDVQPLVNEDTDAARAMNRRVEFDITSY